MEKKYQLFDTEDEISYIEIPLGKFADDIFLGELAEAYHFNLDKAWLDWDAGSDGELTKLYVNWRNK